MSELLDMEDKLVSRFKQVWIPSAQAGGGHQPPGPFPEPLAAELLLPQPSAPAGEQTFAAEQTFATIRAYGWTDLSVCSCSRSSLA